MPKEEVTLKVLASIDAIEKNGLDLLPSGFEASGACVQPGDHRIGSEHLQFRTSLWCVTSTERHRCKISSVALIAVSCSTGVSNAFGVEMPRVLSPFHPLRRVLACTQRSGWWHCGS
jgi:hypothetical protein